MIIPIQLLYCSEHMVVSRMLSSLLPFLWFFPRLI
ncbi:hypothetical protein LINGRAHAP2_LOCUS2843 [Linum grandiflorum]